MSHTYVCGLVHCVFSTKNRRNLIPLEVQPDLWALLGGIARKNGMKVLIPIEVQPGFVEGHDFSRAEKARC